MPDFLPEKLSPFSFDLVCRGYRIDYISREAYYKIIERASLPGGSLFTFNDMATRRMFSKTITSSSQFLMMPQSSQNLYFHLGMNADDDGFCEHFTIMRMTESKPDDLKVLNGKGFVRVFDERVLVITDWKENNYLRNDRYTPSKYLEIYKEEINALVNKTEDGIPAVYQMDTQDRLGKDRLGKVDSKTKVLPSEVIDFYLDIRKMEKPPRSVYGKYLRPAKELLELAPLEEIKKRIINMDKWAAQNDLSWNLGTLIKRWQEESTPERASVVNVDEIIKQRRLQENG